MEYFSQELVRLLEDHHDALTQALAEAMRADGQPIVGMSLGELSQVVRGMRAVFAESLSGQSRDIWGYFFEAVVPGLRDAGAPLEDVVGLAPRLFVLIAALIERHLPPTQRDAALQWLSRFTQRCTREVARVFALAA
jgi:hypothetical protein